MSKGIKICDYKDLRYIGMRWLCRCIDCSELFLGIKGDWLCLWGVSKAGREEGGGGGGGGGDWLCSCCESKPEINKGGE